MIGTTQLALNDGQSLPVIGFGTYPLRGRDGCRAILSALRAGYRLLDSAQNYDNEATVGQALRRSGLSRQEVVVTTKLAGRHQARPLARRAVVESLWRLGVEQIDLCLIHWPNPGRDLYVEAWQALIEARQEGLVRSIGVSNFTAGQLDRLIERTGVTPAVNQIEVHPGLVQDEIRAVNRRLGLVTQAWSPLGRQSVRRDSPPLLAAAQRHGVSLEQVILRWHLQLGCLPLPRSSDPERQRVNLDLFGFELSPAELEAISALGRPGRRIFGSDPETHEEL
ncbi:MAG: aldo/keto reductase [Propionibacteriaceae bacterium]|jgi:diketogulonate reductase-like aldo/keto reductase|nr:aldo/keto reductase [Propionibacteriaceae bacterium]